MQDTYISFYLRTSRVHIFVDSLRGLGSPSRICFMVEESGKSLLIVPHEKRDFKSHRVPPDVYNGTGCMDVSSVNLCRIIANLHHWDLNCSYRVPGKIYEEQKVAIYALREAEIIDRSTVSQE